MQVPPPPPPTCLLYCASTSIPASPTPPACCTCCPPRLLLPPPNLSVRLSSHRNTWSCILLLAVSRAGATAEAGGGHGVSWGLQGPSGPQGAEAARPCFSGHAPPAPDSARPPAGCSCTCSRISRRSSWQQKSRRGARGGWSMWDCRAAAGLAPLLDPRPDTDPSPAGLLDEAGPAAPAAPGPAAPAAPAFPCWVSDV